MKTTRKLLPSLLLLFLLSVASAGTIPPINVTVSNASGKVAYKGTTNADGTFATGNLEPGDYVVEFGSKNSALKGSKFGLAVSAGKNNVSADAVAGDKFVGNGVAMKVAVASATKITGRVASAVSGTKAAAATNSGDQSSAGVKIVNGKKYIWKRPQGLSPSGGEWVEEGSEADPSGTPRTTQSVQPRRSGMRGY